jgi:hypothetical protein
LSSNVPIHFHFFVIASERSNPVELLDCFVAFTPLRKRLAFVAGNDEACNQYRATTGPLPYGALPTGDLPNGILPTAGAWL